MARRAALTDRSGVVAGAGLVHDEHRLLVEIQMKVSLIEYKAVIMIMVINEHKPKGKPDADVSSDLLYFTVCVHFLIVGCCGSHNWRGCRAHEE